MAARRRTEKPAGMSAVHSSKSAGHAPSSGVAWVIGQTLLLAKFADYARSASLVPRHFPSLSKPRRSLP